MPLLLKTFLPQMQSVFIKIIQDSTSSNLRQLAAQVEIEFFLLKKFFS